MKTTLLLGAFAALALSAQAAIPEGGWSVTPQPGSTVESITTITVTKSNEQYMDPYINRSIKVNGEAIAITQKANSAGNSITMTLATPIEKSGVYEIVIPERTFTYNYNWFTDDEDDNPEMSWTVTVDNPNYGISLPAGISVEPAGGSTVETLSTLTLTAAEGSLAAGSATQITISDLPAEVSQQASADGSQLLFTLASPLRTNGEQHIVIPAGTFTYNGEASAEVAWYVTIENSGEPVIPAVIITSTPASGSTVASLSQFTFTFEGAATATRLSDGPAPTLTSGGTACDVAFSYEPGDEANQLVISIEPPVVVSGEYTFTLPAGAVALTADGGAEFACEEAKVNLTVKAPVADGEKFVVDKIRYILLSRDQMTAAVTWPADEADYAGLTTVPTSVEYEGETFTVTEIGDLAFSEVTGINSFTVPEGITRIGEGAFWSSSLKEISIPASVTEIGESAFDDCQSLASFTLPSTVTTLGADILYGCISLKSVSLPENLEAIPAGFMQGCSAITSIDLPASLKTIGEFAFAECTELTDITLPDGLTELGRFCFGYCTGLTKCPVPESVTTMGHGVFYQAGLIEANLPENLTVIPDGTFQCCASLPSFVIGNNVTEIETTAFYWCFALESITFGENVATIGKDAFKGDTSLLLVTCLNPVPATGAQFEQEVYDNAHLVVPDGALEAYSEAEGWKEFLHKESAGVSAIEASGLHVSLSGADLHIEAAGNVALYDATGRCLYSGEATTVTLPAHGLYIVAAEEGSIKIAY